MSVVVWIEMYMAQHQKEQKIIMIMQLSFIR